MVAEPRRAPRRILVTRLRRLGDVILTTPLLANLRRLVPGAEIDYLTHAAYGAVLEGNPDVDRVWTLDSLATPAGLLRYAALIRRLRARRYDWYIDLLFNPRSAALGSWIGARVRVGGDRPKRRKFYDVVFGDPDGTRNAVRVHLEALRAVGLDPRDEPTRVHLGTADLERGAAILRASGWEPSRPPILIHPGGTWQAKRWPVERWCELCGALAAEGAGPVAVLVGPGEEPIGCAVAGGANGHAVRVPRLGLRDVAALLARVAGVVADDGGILHLAVALGTPTVGVFGPTEADIWFPYPEDGRTRLVSRPIPCRPCHRHECGHVSCLTGLPVESVLCALQEVVPS